MHQGLLKGLNFKIHVHVHVHISDEIYITH